MRHTVARAVRRSRAPVLGVLLALGAALSPPSAFAQEQIVIRADFLFYGDNTEFHGPFRDGETIFGAAGRVAGEIWLNDRVAVSAGAFGKSAIWFGSGIRRGASCHRAPGAHGSLVTRCSARCRRRTATCLSALTLAVLTGCSRRSSARRSHTNARTKQASRGSSIAQGSIIISGSHGSVSTRLVIASGSTEDCGPICGSAAS